MQKELFNLVLILTMLTAAPRLFGSAASTFAGTTPMAAPAPTNLTPFALMMPTDDTNEVVLPSTLTFAWNPVLDYQFGPLTYNLGMRLNAASNFTAIANTSTTNYSTTNVPTVQTEYAVQAVSTNLVGSKLVSSTWSKSVFFPPDPTTNICTIALLSVPNSSSTNWTVITNFANWTNPPTVMPGLAAFWKMQTFPITTNITELRVMKSSGISAWTSIYTVSRWTNSPPATRWKLDFWIKVL